VEPLWIFHYTTAYLKLKLCIKNTLASQRHHKEHFITTWVAFRPLQIVIAAQLVREVFVRRADLEIFAKGTLVALECILNLN
jgi:hypothetical protein